MHSAYMAGHMLQGSECNLGCKLRYCPSLEGLHRAAVKVFSYMSGVGSQVSSDIQGLPQEWNSLIPRAVFITMN